MDDEEYLELAALIGARLARLGLDDIADVSNYMDEEMERRSLPHGRVLVKQMLEAFDRYLVANAAETVTESLSLIGNCTGAELGPESALLHFDDDRAAALAGRERVGPIPTLGHVAEVREDLRLLGEALLAE